MLFANRNIVLASASTRRLSILRQIGIEPELCPTDVAELNELSANMDGESLVTKNAVLKAKAAAGKYDDAIVIGADTVVVMGDKLFSKPENEADAAWMLQELSGKSHLVYTGICLLDTKNNKSISGADINEVTFYQLSVQEINDYVATKEPMDKAGAYGIQEKGALLVNKINGDYYSVMGLSLSLLRKLEQVLKSL